MLFNKIKFKLIAIIILFFSLAFFTVVFVNSRYQSTLQTASSSSSGSQANEKASSSLSSISADQSSTSSEKSEVFSSKPSIESERSSEENQSSLLNSANSSTKLSQPYSKITEIKIEKCDLKGTLMVGTCDILDQNNNLILKKQTMGVSHVWKKTGKSQLIVDISRAYGVCTYYEFELEFQTRELKEIKALIGCDNPEVISTIENFEKEFREANAENL